MDERGLAAPGPTFDSLRADLAETKLVVHDLTTQLDEAKAQLEVAESMNRAVGDESQGDEATVKAAHEAQQGQAATIKRLEKEVNGLNTKVRMLEVHNDLLVEQEKELRASFDQVLFYGGLAVVLFVCFAVVEVMGVTDVIGTHAGKRFAQWWKEGCDCAATTEAPSCPAPAT